MLIENDLLDGKPTIEHFPNMYFRCKYPIPVELPLKENLVRLVLRDCFLTSMPMKYIRHLKEL